MNKVVFMGDSITAGFKKLNDYKHIINIGVGGYKTTECIPLVKELRILNPNILILMIGINDYLYNIPLYDHAFSIPFHKTYDTLLDLIRVNLPKTKIYLVSILPLNERLERQLSKEVVFVHNQDIRVINKFIQHQAKVYQATYIDLYSEFLVEGYLNPQFTDDGLHLNEHGYNAYLAFLKKNTTDIFK